MIIINRKNTILKTRLKNNIGKKVLLTYGGGSIKKIGLYQKVLELLQLAAVQYWTAPRRLRQAPARHDPRHTFRHIRLLSCHFIGSKTFANFVIV